MPLMWVLCHVTGFALDLFEVDQVPAQLPHSEWCVYCLFAIPPLMTVCCSVLQCVAVRCSVLQCVAVCMIYLHYLRWWLCVAVCCSVLQRVAVCCSVYYLFAIPPLMTFNQGTGICSLPRALVSQPRWSKPLPRTNSLMCLCAIHMRVIYICQYIYICTCIYIIYTCRFLPPTRWCACVRYIYVRHVWPYIYAIYIYIYTDMYIHMHMCVHTYKSIFIIYIQAALSHQLNEVPVRQIYACHMCMLIYIHIHIHIYICIYLYTQAASSHQLADVPVCHIYACHIYMPICIHTYIHIYICMYIIYTSHFLALTCWCACVPNICLPYIYADMYTCAYTYMHM